MHIKKTLFMAVFALFTWQELFAFKVLNFTRKSAIFYFSGTDMDMDVYVIKVEPYTTHVFNLGESFKSPLLVFLVMSDTFLPKRERVFSAKDYYKSVIENDWGVVFIEEFSWGTANDQGLLHIESLCLPSHGLDIYNENLLKKKNFIPHKEDNLIRLKPENSWW